MANLRSLIVKIGADVTDIQKAFTDVGQRSKTVQDALKSLGNTPLGTKTVEDLNRLTANLNLVTAGYQKVADNSLKAAQGISALGGPARLTSNDLDLMNRTVLKGIDAYRALGQEAPKELQKVAEAIKEQKAALASLNAPASGGGGLSSLLNLVSPLNLSAAALGSTLVVAGKQALTFADTLTKLSDKTGIGVEALQRLDAIAGPSGNTLEEISNGVNKLQKNLVGGGESTSHALDKIGLSIGQLRGLDPEEQFAAIAKGIQGIKDPAEQTAIAIALFGKSGAELLPTLKADVDKLKDSTVIMSKEAVKALDDFGDALDTLKKSSINVVGEILAQFLKVPKAIRDATPKAPERTADTSALAQGPAAFAQGIADDLAAQAKLFAAIPKIPAQVVGVEGVDALARLNAGLEEETRRATEAAESLDRVRKIQEQLFSTTIIRNANEYVRALGDIQNISKLTETEQGKLRQTMVDALTAYEAAGKEAPPALRKIIVEIDSLAHAQKALDTAAAGSNGALIGFNFSLDQLSNLAKGFTANGLLPLAKGFDDVSRAELGAKLYADQLAASHAALQRQLATPFGLPNVTSSLDRTPLDEPLKKWKSELSEISTALSHLAQVSDGAFGEMVRDIANVIVSLDVVEQGLNKFTTATTNTGKAVGLASAAAGFLQATSSKNPHSAVVGGVLTGAEIGQKYGGTAGAVIGGTVGLFVGLFRALSSSAEKEINPIRQAFVNLNGGLDVLNKHAHDAGTTLDALLNAKNPEQYKKAIDDLSAAFATLQGKIDDANTDLAGLLSSAVDLGGTLPKTFDPAIQKLIDMGRITKDNADLFAVLTGSTGVDFRKMEDIAKKYGLSLSDLGPAFQSAKLADTAKSVINDFDTLVRGGADVDKVLAGLKKPINDIVNDSIKFGVAIPANMKPWVDQLLLTHQLVDENGKEITDLGQLKFADPIVTEFDKLIKTIQDLIDKLTGPLTGAITGLPKPDGITVPITYTYNYDTPPQDNYAATGGRVTASGIVPLHTQYFGRGGRVLPFLARGTDTVPAMLTPGEVVLTAAQQRSAGEATTPTVIYHVTNNISAIDPKSFQEVLDKTGIPYIVETIEDGRRGYHTRIKRAIG